MCVIIQPGSDSGDCESCEKRKCLPEIEPEGYKVLKLCKLGGDGKVQMRFHDKDGSSVAKTTLWQVWFATPPDRAIS